LPLWSLANETWYYVLFPLLMALFSVRNKAARVASGAAFVLLVALLPGELVGYFSIWLLGVAFSRIQINCGAGARFGWLVLLFAAAVYYRLTWNLDPFDCHTVGPDSNGDRRGPLHSLLRGRTAAKCKAGASGGWWAALAMDADLMHVKDWQRDIGLQWVMSQPRLGGSSYARVQLCLEKDIRCWWKIPL
jgi:hypothetical protein